MITMKADESGPFFDGRANKAIQDFLDEVTFEAAGEGAELVKDDLRKVIRNPTPIYWTRVRTVESMNGATTYVHNLPYDHWIEGTGSRNKTTRFKGYFAFRRMTQVLRQRIPTIVRRTIRPYLGRMN